MFTSTLRALALLLFATVAFAANSPKFVIYHDEWIQGQDSQIPTPAQLQGFNVLNLSFLMLSGAVDMAQVWEQMSAADRASTKAAYAEAGIALMVSAFGSTDAPTSAGADPVATANKMAAWVKQYDLDGIDVDYEDFGAVGANMHGAATWLATFTKTLRAQLPAGQYFITHAPVAPWFSAADGVYKAFDAAAGSAVDWYNVQFYNQGGSEYTTCAGLFDKSSDAWPGTSVFELHTVQGIPLDKIVVGKPGVASQAANGFIAPADLAVCAAAAALKGWNAGIMTWEYTPTHVDSTWAHAVRAATWPVSGGGGITIPGGGAPPPPPASSSKASSSSKAAPTSSSKAAPTSSKTTSSAAKTPTPSSATSSSKAAPTSSIKTTTSAKTSTSTVQASTATAASKTSAAPSACGTASAWNAATTYWAGDAIAYAGTHYTAKWWSVGDVPTASGEWGVWKPAGACAPQADAQRRKMVRMHKRHSH